MAWSENETFCLGWSNWTNARWRFNIRLSATSYQMAKCIVENQFCQVECFTFCLVPKKRNNKSIETEAILLRLNWYSIWFNRFWPPKISRKQDICSLAMHYYVVNKFAVILFTTAVDSIVDFIIQYQKVFALRCCLFVLFSNFGSIVQFFKSFVNEMWQLNDCLCRCNKYLKHRYSTMPMKWKFNTFVNCAETELNKITYLLGFFLKMHLRSWIFSSLFFIVLKIFFSSKLNFIWTRNPVHCRTFVPA